MTKPAKEIKICLDVGQNNAICNITGTGEIRIIHRIASDDATTVYISPIH